VATVAPARYRLAQTGRAPCARSTLGRSSPAETGLGRKGNAPTESADARRWLSDDRWALDLTTMPGAGKPILGMIDHGTRACLALREVPFNSSIAILRFLLDAIELYGKPKVLRSDNGSTFTSRLFRFALFWLGIRHQRTEPMAPWQNGRIERLFGTFKRKIRAWIAEGGNVEKLYQELDVFRCWYNHIRPHQNLDGLTPGEAWDGLEEPKSRGQPRFFEGWDGNLTGFL
jgi:putative transposase